MPHPLQLADPDTSWRQGVHENAAGPDGFRQCTDAAGQNRNPAIVSFGRNAPPGFVPLTGNKQNFRLPVDRSHVAGSFHKFDICQTLDVLL